MKFAQESKARSFIVGTEQGLIDSLQRLCPDKEFYPAAQHMTCPDMKFTTLEKVKESLEKLEPSIQVDPDTAEKARKALSRMLEIV